MAFGNTRSSSLISSAEAAYKRTQAYNDSIAAYEYDLSPKDAGSLQRYQDYLNKRMSESKSDPGKQLTLQKTLTGAYRSYNSAEIGRYTTSVKYGDMDNSSKYNQLSGLRQAALENGDLNLAQNIENQMASLSVTIQNEQIAAQNRSESDARKQESAVNKAYMKAISEKEQGIKELNALKFSGRITPAQYEDQLRQLYTGSPDGSQPGILDLVAKAKEATGDPNGTYQNKLNTLGADRQVQGLVNGVNTAAGMTGNLVGKTIVRNVDGTYDFKQRPDSEIMGTQLVRDNNGNVVKDANGHAITLPTYANPQATLDKNNKLTGFQYATAIDSKTGMPAPGAGAQAIRQVGQNELNYDDPSGVPYFYNELGQKKYVGKDSQNGRPIMANDPTLINGKDNFGSTNVYGQTFDPMIKKIGPTGAGFGLGTVAGALAGPIGGLFGGVSGALFARDQQQQAAQLAQAKTQAAKLAEVTAAKQTMAPTVAARVALPAVAKNITPAGNSVIATAKKANPAAPINTKPVTQAQAASANFVGANGGYQTNIQPQKTKTNIFAKIGSFLGF